MTEQDKIIQDLRRENSILKTRTLYALIYFQDELNAIQKKVAEKIDEINKEIEAI